LSGETRVIVAAVGGDRHDLAARRMTARRPDGEMSNESDLVGHRLVLELVVLLVRGDVDLDFVGAPVATSSFQLPKSSS
jgi:hypothetical protein